MQEETDHANVQEKQRCFTKATTPERREKDAVFAA